MGHARALLGISDGILQTKIARDIVSKNWSVRRSEARVRLLGNNKQNAKKKNIIKISANYTATEKDLVEKLQSYLGTKVDLHRGKEGSGKLIVHYFTQEELGRLVNLVFGSEEI